ncbi:sterile alpha motif domain-containing protein 3-like isoform X1 [Ornithodoros turicata]|uniref:sterile alpha motif domain-containing protein 3-like isoform X1 n=1 Tax=Ornithodoros turicata TaxID=34597 RepID=UPI003138A76B
MCVVARLTSASVEYSAFGILSTMPSVTCLITIPHADVRRKCQLEDCTVSALRKAIAESSILAPNVDDNVRFQILDGDFNEYVELDDGDQIPNMSCVRVIRPGPSSASSTSNNDHSECMPTAAESTSEPHAGTSGSGQFDIVVNDADHDGKGFSFPDFGTLHAIIKPDVPLTSSAHKKIINALYQSMIKCSITPNRGFYMKVVCELLKRYPSLADVVGPGHDSWLASLRTKFKNERRRLPDDQRIIENRVKYGGQKRKRSDGNVEEELKRRKLHGPVTAEVTVCSVAIEGEDGNFQDLEDWLIKENESDSPNEELIDWKMTLTLKQRTAAIVSVPVLQTKLTYPYLMDATRFFKEFERRYDRHPLQCTSAALQQIRTLVLRQKIKCKEELREQLLADEDRTGVCERRRKHLLAVHTLEIISACVKQRKSPAHLFVKDGKPLEVWPSVVFTGNNVEEAEHMFLHVDKVSLFRVIDLEEGLAAIMAAYWIFQIVYHKESCNVLCALERLCLKLSDSRARPPVVKFFNRYRKEFESGAENLV